MLAPAVMLLSLGIALAEPRPDAALHPPKELVRPRGLEAGAFGLPRVKVAPPAPLAAFEDRLRRSVLGEMSVYAEVLTVNGAFTGLARTLGAQPGRSSSLVTALMAASTTYSLRHADEPWPWVLTAGLGTSLALERMVAEGKPFPSDVVVGAVAGATVGIVVPAFHAKTGLRLDVAPMPGGGARFAVGGNLP